MKRIYKRTSLVVNKVKKLCRQGGRQMQNYLQQEWDIQLSSKDKRTCHQDVVEKQLRTERSSLLKEKKSFTIKQILYKNRLLLYLIKCKRLAVEDTCLVEALQNENLHQKIPIVTTED